MASMRPRLVLRVRQGWMPHTLAGERGVFLTSAGILYIIVTCRFMGISETHVCITLMQPKFEGGGTQLAISSFHVIRISEAPACTEPDKPSSRECHTRGGFLTSVAGNIIA